MRSIMILCTCTDVNKNKQRYYGRVHAGHNSKSTRKAVFHFWYIISFVCLTKISKHCKNKQYFTCPLNAMHRWAIPQDNRMVH